MAKTSKLLLSLSLCLSALCLSGCFGLFAGAAATVGVAAVQEGGVSAAATDARIQIEINDHWFRYDIDVFRKLDMTVNQGRVLLTGVVQDPEHRVEAVRLAWQPSGVKQVINEIRVAESRGFGGFARDSWITTQLRSKITFNKDVLSINYNIDTVQGSVYLLGVAQSQMELNRVIEIARTIPNVKQVVSYVKLAGRDEIEDANSANAYGGQSYGGAQNNGVNAGANYSGGNNGAINWNDSASAAVPSGAPVNITGDVNGGYSAGSYQVEPLSPPPPVNGVPINNGPITSERLLGGY